MRKVLLLAVVLFAVACSSDAPAVVGPIAPRSTATTTFPVAFPPVVAALGDSLLFGGVEDLRTALGATRLEGHAVIGVRIEETAADRERLLGESPAVFVVALGTNNATDGLTSSDLRAVDEMVAGLAGRRCVRWVDVSTSFPRRPWNDAARAINAEIKMQMAGKATMRIIPWSAALTKHPEWISADGVHHTVAGTSAFIEMITGAVRECLEDRG
ncbi:MAG TPA: hypothetical protein VMY34_05120 [Acidimicrobiales bacterium]|nr:hypothetical protein [Acidimicrobiales bacterium]